MFRQRLRQARRRDLGARLGCGTDPADGCRLARVFGAVHDRVRLADRRLRWLLRTCGACSAMLVIRTVRRHESHTRLRVIDFCAVYRKTSAPPCEAAVGLGIVISIQIVT